MHQTLDKWEEINPDFAWDAFLKFPDNCTFTEFCETAYRENWEFDENYNIYTPVEV